MESIDYYYYLNPMFYLKRGWSIIVSMGWYLIGLAVLLYYAFPYIQKHYILWKQKKDEEEYAAKYHKNLMQERLSGVEAARQRMQKFYTEMAAEAQLKEEERKKKKQEELAKLVQKDTCGHVINYNNSPGTSQGSQSKSLKSEYNPLMGDSNKRYKPPKRKCRGSNCGGN
ncbi:uncharacterized protein [Prorops nasuta]|uniref:uncharacterized protein isoform X2 n=1 Tax=Prorops nasuta TaxID=863751 RepID=UPI0034CDE358